MPLEGLNVARPLSLPGLYWLLGHRATIVRQSLLSALDASLRRLRDSKGNLGELDGSSGRHCLLRSVLRAGATEIMQFRVAEGFEVGIQTADFGLCT